MCYKSLSFFFHPALSFCSLSSFFYVNLISIADGFTYDQLPCRCPKDGLLVDPDSLLPRTQLRASLPASGHTGSGLHTRGLLTPSGSAGGLSFPHIPSTT